jgi:hypothetical protein
MTTAVVRTNIRKMEMIKVTIAFTSLSAPTQKTITVTGISLGDMVLLLNQYTTVTGQMPYTISNAYVSAKGKVTFNVTPSFTPGTGGGFDTVAGAGVWYMLIFRPEYLASIPKDAAAPL